MVFDFDYAGANTCVLLSIESSCLVDRIPYRLKCGEVLRVGDKFNYIGTAGSAGFSAITLSDGWYQQMEGMVLTPHWNDGGELITWVVFSAFNHDGISALDEVKMKFPNTYIAYTAIGNGSLHYFTRSSSSRFIKCDSIRRL